MEVKSKLIAKYSQIGHPQYPEDTWETESEIDNKDQLLQFMKDIFKRDAYSFNDFPFNGSCCMSCFEFYVEKWVELDGEKYVNNKRVKSDLPNYFKDAENEYKIYIERIRKTLPNLRKAKSKRDKEMKEKANYERLRMKFETNS